MTDARGRPEREQVITISDGGLATVRDPAAEHTLRELSTGAGARMGGENFPVALRVLPAAVRRDLAAVYAFARFVDEVGDTAVGPRLALLDRVADDVRALPCGATLPAVAGLAPLVDRGAVALEPLLDLVEANRVDQERHGYETFDDLLGYCCLSAAPVGRLVLGLAGASTAQNIAWSDHVCNALQVLEHCQDVAEDARAGRVYLPAAELRAAGADGLGLGRTPDPVRRVVALQVLRSRQLLRSGVPLVEGLHGWARVAVAGFVAGGLATADALDAAGHDVLGRDVRPSKARTARHAVHLFRGRGA